MPYNFDVYKKYNFDYEILYAALEQEPIYRKNKLYIERWIYIFNSLENIEARRLEKLNRSENLGEFYQYKFKIQSQAFLLHFNIESILKIINQNSPLYCVQQIPLSSFGTTGYSYIQYATEQVNQIKKGSTMPVILCLFPTENSQYIVIDGNHRVSYLIKNGEKIINVVGYSPFDKQSFLSLVDWAMYWFKIEVQQFSDLVNQGYNFDELIKQSHAYNMFKDI